VTMTTGVDTMKATHRRAARLYPGGSPRGPATPGAGCPERMARSGEVDASTAAALSAARRRAAAAAAAAGLVRAEDGGAGETGAAGRGAGRACGEGGFGGAAGRRAEGAVGPAGFAAAAGAALTAPTVFAGAVVFPAFGVATEASAAEAAPLVAFAGSRAVDMVATRTRDGRGGVAAALAGGLA
jgi:hypothetical protein